MVTNSYQISLGNSASVIKYPPKSQQTSLQIHHARREYTTSHSVWMYAPSPWAHDIGFESAVVLCVFGSYFRLWQPKFCKSMLKDDSSRPPKDDLSILTIIDSGF